MAKYSLVGESPSAYHLKHSDGSTFAVAKAGLDDEAHAKIKKLAPVKMAAGGIVEETPIAQAVASQPSSWDNSMASLSNSASQLGENLKPLVVGAAPDASLQGALNQAAQSTADFQSPPDMNANPQPQVAVPAANPAPGAAAPAAPGAPTAGIPFGPARTPATAADPTAGPFGQMRGGIKDEANANADSAQKEQTAYGDYQKDALNAKQAFDAKIAKQDAQRAGLEKDIADNKVDPERFWHNKSTGSKIASVIGLMLGGLGGGASGKNAALDVLQGQIKADIDSQLSNLGNKKTLLEANFKATGDIHQAYTQTMDQMLTAVKARVAGIAAGAQGPLAQARAKQLLGQLSMQQKMLGAQAATRNQQVQAASTGIPEGSDAQLRASNPEYAKKAVKIGHTTFLTGDEKDAEKVKDWQSTVEPVREIVQRIDALGPSAAIPGTAEYQKAQALRGQFGQALNSLHDIKRFSPESIKAMSEQISDPTSFKQLMQKGVRNNEFLKTVDSETEALYKARVPGYKGSVSASGVAKPGFK